EQRAIGGQAPLDNPTDAEYFAALREQRAREFFLDGHRIGDLRRYEAQQGVDLWPTGPMYGAAITFGERKCCPSPCGGLLQRAGRQATRVARARPEDPPGPASRSRGRRAGRDPARAAAGGGPGDRGAGTDRAAGGAWWPAPAAARLTPGRPRGTLGYGWGGGGEAITPARERGGERLLSMQGLRRRASITGFLRGKALLRHGGDAGRALRMP